jgi:hypothetical protein
MRTINFYAVSMSVSIMLLGCSGTDTVGGADAAVPGAIEDGGDGTGLDDPRRKLFTDARTPSGDVFTGNFPDVRPAADGKVISPITATSCEAAQDISLASSHTDIMINTKGSIDSYDVPCAPNGVDGVLSFFLMQRELVYADTFGANWDTALYFTNACGDTLPELPGTFACSNDACGTTQSQATAVLDYGRHYLVVSGIKGATGTATVHFQHVPIGEGPVRTLPAGEGNVMGTTSGNGQVNSCDGAAGDDSYWWNSCPNYAGGSLSATTCNGAAFDTILNFQSAGTSLMVCADDDRFCGQRSTLNTTVPAGAGIHVMTIDGPTSRSVGKYRITYARP